MCGAFWAEFASVQCEKHFSIVGWAVSFKNKLIFLIRIRVVPSKAVASVWNILNNTLLIWRIKDFRTHCQNLMSHMSSIRSQFSVGVYTEKELLIITIKFSYSNVDSQEFTSEQEFLSWTILSEIGGSIINFVPEFFGALSSILKKLPKIKLQKPFFSY